MESTLVELLEMSGMLVGACRFPEGAVSRKLTGEVLPCYDFKKKLYAA
jgi:hypothetical protein